MNSGNITAIVLALIAMVGTTIGLYVNRVDRATKLTRTNLRNMAEDLEIVGALRKDVWNWEDWARGVVIQWNDLQNDLKRQGAITEMHPLPARPESELRKLERARADGDDG